jgi:hypothetical protein
MIRRSFRVGLWLGILLGVVIALVKSLQGHRDARELAAPPPGRWGGDPLPTIEQVVTESAADPIDGPGPPAAENSAIDPPAAAPSRSWAEEPWTDDMLPPPAGGAAAEEAPPPRARSVKSPPSPAPTSAAAPASSVPGRRNAKAPVKRPARNWVEPTGAVCPRTHPVKAKMASGLFHLPGMLNYARTRPDRCYASEEAAIADGLTKSKR